MNSLLDHTPLNSDLINIIVKYEKFSLVEIYEKSVDPNEVEYDSQNLLKCLLKCVYYKYIGFAHFNNDKKYIQSVFDCIKFLINDNKLSDDLYIGLFNNHYQVVIRKLIGKGSIVELSSLLLL